MTTLVVAILVATSCTSAPPLGVAPGFRVEEPGPTGKVIKLEDYKGKVLLIDFWATWCGPCKESTPILEDFYARYKDKGVAVIGISQEDKATVQNYISSKPFSYPVYVDPTGDANTAYQATQIPLTIVVSKDGNMLFRGSPFDNDQVEAAIKEGLK